MQGAIMVTRACLAAAVLACMAGQAAAWGSYSCNLTPADKERLANATLKSAQQVNASVSNLEEKVDTILALLSGPRQTQWLPPPDTKDTDYSDVAGRRERSDRGERSREDGDSGRVEHNREREEYNREREERHNGTEKPENEENTRRRENDETDRREAETKPETERETVKDEEEESGPKKGECAVMVTDNHATIGMFFMSTYNHGHCANRNPITTPVRYCLGYCPTRSFVTRKDNIWGQGHECKSCQPSRLENIRIPLVCDDGFQFEKNFKNVVECACRNCRSLKG